MASVFDKAVSELSRHTEPGGTRDDEEDSWIVAGDSESVDSFLTNCPPSYMEKAWISASHDGRAQLIEEYYAAMTGTNTESWGRDNMEEIRTAWEESESKTIETLSAVLKEHKYGCGKWMIFVSASDVDAVWRKVVTALWDGKLGHSAKVSGNTAEAHGSHVINVYVDPFWETSEVERVLTALRELCGVGDAIKFKADGVSQLGLGKGNEHGIPPSFYAAGRGSCTASLQKVSGGSRERRSEWGGERSESRTDGGEASRAPYGKNDDKWGSRGSTWMRREAPKPTPRSAPPPPPAKKADKPKASAFAALMGMGDGEDAEAIMAKKAAKTEKKRRKAAEAEAAAAACSEASFEALKAGLKGGGWGEDDEEEEVEERAPEAEEEEEEDSSSEEDEEDEEDEEEAAAPAAAVPDISDPVPARPDVPKAKTAEELEVEAVLAALDSNEGGSGAAASGEPKGLSKAAAKRAKKKAAAAAAEGSGEKGDEAAAVEKPAEAAEEENAPENLEDKSDAQIIAEGKTPADIKKLLAAKAAGKKKTGANSSGAAAVLAEAKAREASNGGKKKKGPKTWEASRKQVGQKARGSDNKYQGE